MRLLRFLYIWVLNTSKDGDHSFSGNCPTACLSSWRKFFFYPAWTSLVSSYAHCTTMPGSTFWLNLPIGTGGLLLGDFKASSPGWNKSHFLSLSWQGKCHRPLISSRAWGPLLNLFQIIDVFPVQNWTQKCIHGLRHNGIFIFLKQHLCVSQPCSQCLCLKPIKRLSYK